MAGSLALMVARFSAGQVNDAEALAATAERLRDAALELAAEDGMVYGRLLALEREGSEGELEAARLAVARVPLAMVEIAAELAPLLARLCVHGKVALRGDALSGLRLLQGAAAAAAGLVRIDAQQLASPHRAELLGELEGAEREVAGCGADGSAPQPACSPREPAQ